MPIRASELATMLIARVDAIVSQRVGCGVLVLTSSLRIWFMDSHARRFIQRMRPRATGESAAQWVPPDIRCLGQALLAKRDTHRSLKRNDHLGLQRVVAWKNEVILLRGVLLPSCALPESAALLMLLERIVLERDGDNWDVQHLEGFSLREKTIVSFLVQGCTDKEIASRLNLSLHTVREYVRNLKQKTSSPTRAAVVANVLLQHDPSLGKRVLAEIGEPAATESHCTPSGYET